MSGLAGAPLSIALLNVFQQGMTAGQGFIAVALVYFGAWKPWGVLGGALLFSLVNGLQLWIQVLGDTYTIGIFHNDALFPDNFSPDTYCFKGQDAICINQTI